MSELRRPGDLEVRDDLVAHYQAYARGRGADPSLADLERLAIGDLEITDRVEAESRAAPARAATEVLDPEPAPPAPAEQLAVERGYRFEKRALPIAEPAKVLPPLFEKPRALARRIAQICAREPGSPKTLSIADQLFVHPALAKQVMQEHTDYTYRRRRYRGLSDVDRQRAFWRAMEDVADRSTGVLGPWWVK